MYRYRLEEEPQYQNYTHFEAAGMAFDAVWAIALGLNNVVNNKTNNSDCEDLPGEMIKLENFNYTNEKMGCVLQKGFESVNFKGITVSVHALFITIKLFTSLARETFHLQIGPGMTTID